MRHLLSIALFLLAFHTVSQAQITVKGRVVDKETREAVPFATIIIRGHALGTTTSESGEFSFRITESLRNDIAEFSCMGYSSVRFPLAAIIEKDNRIELIKKNILLSEAIVKPLSVEDYVRIAVERIPQNHSTKPFLAKAYYYEFTTENENFVKFEEAITSTYFPAFGDTSESQSSILYGRTSKDVEDLQFMRSKMERKEKRAAKKGKPYEPLFDPEDLTSVGGGPSEVLGAGIILENPDFLDPKHFNLFKYSLDGIVAYGDHKLLEISFVQRRRHDHQKRTGKLYLDAETYAFAAIEFTGKIFIPALLKPIIAMVGIGIGNPDYSMRVHFREYDGTWYVSNAFQNINLDLSTTDLFRKNDHSSLQIEQAYVVESLEMENVSDIPEDQRVNFEQTFEEQARFKDTDFWDDYTPMRPKRLESFMD